MLVLALPGGLLDRLGVGGLGAAAVSSALMGDLLAPVVAHVRAELGRAWRDLDRPVHELLVVEVALEVLALLVASAALSAARDVMKVRRTATRLLTLAEVDVQVDASARSRSGPALGVVGVRALRFGFRLL